MILTKKEKKRTYILQEDLFFGVKYNKEVFPVEKFGKDLYLIKFRGITVNVASGNIVNEYRRTIAKTIYEDNEIVYLIIPKDVE